MNRNNDPKIIRHLDLKDESIQSILTKFLELSYIASQIQIP